jgi:hypothetical protein
LSGWSPSLHYLGLRYELGSSVHIDAILDLLLRFFLACWTLKLLRLLHASNSLWLLGVLRVMKLLLWVRRARDGLGMLLRTFRVLEVLGVVLVLRV